VRALEHFKEQVVEWATEMDEQSSNYEMMREYTLNLEADLKHYQSQFANLVETYNEISKEREQLLAWQAHARSQIAEYEKSILEREKESESISQHAMYMSLEVELLRRKLQELDEDVMVKEGQISILQSTWESD
jgi:chromosome segregation ATPase